MRTTPGSSLARISVWVLLLLAGTRFLSGCTEDKGTDPPIPQLDKTSLDFGEVAVGSSADRSFTVENIGAGTLSGTFSETCPEFSIVAGGGDFAVEKDEVLVVTIRFTPSSTGTKSCTVRSGNDGLGRITCEGVGIEPVDGSCCNDDGACCNDDGADGQGFCGVCRLSILACLWRARWR
ncbi:MAG: hypothetical protein KC729_20425, partial [Candidatus Eisenbacteria bacterium]|nr:hypothetical protein [Candidatus Eisenbacteria bacterium]